MAARPCRTDRRPAPMTLQESFGHVRPPTQPFMQSPRESGNDNIAKRGHFVRFSMSPDPLLVIPTATRFRVDRDFPPRAAHGRSLFEQIVNLVMCITPEARTPLYQSLSVLRGAAKRSGLDRIGSVRWRNITWAIRNSN